VRGPNGRPHSGDDLKDPREKSRSGGKKGKAATRSAPRQVSPKKVKEQKRGRRVRRGGVGSILKQGGDPWGSLNLAARPGGPTREVLHY